MSDNESKQEHPNARVRPARPFHTINAAHIITRTAEALDWDLDNVENFIKTAEHVEFGLSAELELSAILRWLGPCRMVHRLAEDAFVADTAAQQIPDLVATFESNGEHIVTLIEVKTTADPVLHLKANYLDRLRRYAEILGHPLLVGWRCRAIDMWLLFDPFAIGLPRAGGFDYTLEDVMKVDLMSLIAGDFYLVPTTGTGLRFEMERTGDKIATKEGYQAEFTVRRAYFHDGEGRAETELPQAMIWTVLSGVRANSNVEDGQAVQSFTSTGGLRRAQNILKTALQFQTKGDQRIRWKGVADDLDSIVRCTDILTESRARFGTYVQYIFLQKPRVTPTFLPPKWRSKNEPD
ncbi:hypothetical protein [uncultured Parasphingorhabdus sp.]|uniref:hypothetical protein n=1 Tax=uncultured Parasphingorhabdus sp. TaxID=2709694 RepID=UPI0030D930C0